jgi:hypothetical protein
LETCRLGENNDGKRKREKCEIKNGERKAKGAKITRMGQKPNSTMSSGRK